MEPRQIGERIRRAREARGLSQEQLAEQIARDQRSVSEYESGKRRIYAHDLPTIARALAVPLIYFYEDVLSPDDLDNALLETFHRMDTEARRTLLEVLDLLSHLIAERR